VNVFGWIRRHRRKRLLERKVPAGWLDIIRQRFHFFERAEPDVQRRFVDQLRVFAHEKHFIGAGGLDVTEEMKVVISGAAVRLTLHLDVSYYDRLTEIVVYPHAYRHPHRTGVVLGEAQSWGTVVLSWPAVLHGLDNPCDGHNTALHEFAHVLDRADGAFDGTPELRATEDYRPWAQVMTLHFDALRDGDETAARVLRDYGGKNEAEFFAVATESFFERPVRMKAETPELYDVLMRFYGFDPEQHPVCADSPEL
jgi:Mlc titration factor MtfA (ptsG expression regulator)